MGMQMIFPRLIVFLSLPLVFLSGCYTAIDVPQLGQKLSGTWEHSETGAVLVIRSDGRFTHSMPNQNPLEGALTRGYDQLRFSYNEGADICSAEPGQYTFEREGDVLILSIVNDPCSVRRRHLADSWRLVVE